MPLQKSYHSPHGGFDFLGLRKCPSGAVVIVYDDGVARRLKWRVRSTVSEGAVSEALRNAASQTRMLPALYSELKRRSIAIEAVGG